MNEQQHLPVHDYAPSQASLFSTAFAQFVRKLNISERQIKFTTFSYSKNCSHLDREILIQIKEY